MPRPSPLTDHRLRLLYDADGFGGERTSRARVIRELIDEILRLRRELAEAERRGSEAPRPATWHPRGPDGGHGHDDDEGR